ncbi:MAG: hypothetical protein WA432_03080 [Candidatus Babeliaceae bacterium]
MIELFIIFYNDWYMGRIDKKTGKALKIERVKVVDSDLVLQDFEQFKRGKQEFTHSFN